MLNASITIISIGCGLWIRVFIRLYGRDGKDQQKVQNLIGSKCFIFFLGWSQRKSRWN